MGRDNPVLNTQIGFLTADYFHNRIRHAFREGAEVDEVPFESEARQLTATRVTIRPFENDPKRDRMAGGVPKRAVCATE